MNKSTRTNYKHSTIVKQEIENDIDEKKPLPSLTPCTSVLKCEYDPDCGCPQCRFNANTMVKSDEQQIKLEGDNDECNDNKVNTSATQFWMKCVKKEEGNDDDFCGCEDCRGVGDSRQSNRQVKMRNAANLTEIDEQSAQSHSVQIEHSTNQDLDEIQSTADDIGDCPTPDYVPPFFSEDDDEEMEEEEEEKKDQIDGNKDDDIYRPNSRRWSDRVANKPKIKYTYREEFSESDSDSVFEPSDDEKSEDEDTELEDNVEIPENTCRASKSKQPRENTSKKQINKKVKLSHSKDETSDEHSSDEDTEIESEIETSKATKKSKQSNKRKLQHSYDEPTSENISDEEDNEEPKKNKRFERRVFIVRLNCSECNETFKSSHRLHQHLKSSHKIKFYRCLVRDCATSFNLKSQITDHLQTKHSNLTNKWPCGECDSKVTNHRQLEKHTSKYHQKGYFKCTFKGCRFESKLYKSGVLNHYKTNHIEAIIKCPVEGCGMSFRGQGPLNTHAQVHSDEKKFQCELCERGFSDKVSLTIHLAKVHQIGQLTQFKCIWPKCKWNSIHRCNVIRHVREKHFKKGDKRAPKEFISKIKANEKIEKQDKSKVFVTLRLNCLVDGCVEHFPDKRQLNIHLSKCHQIEEFCCAIRGCSVSFKNKNHFAAHRKEIHHKQKVLHCGKCNFTSRIYMVLRNHMYHFHEEGHFRCAHRGCSFVSYTTRSEMWNHRGQHR